MKTLSLNTGERLHVIAALCLANLTAPNKARAGTNMRLAKKIFRTLDKLPPVRRQEGETL